MERLEGAWEKAPIVWLSGVRRVGKTTLAQELSDALLLNCDLPSSRRRLADPERFFASVEQSIVILDEVHRLEDPSWVLKIGADAFPHLKILATGSSTLAATSKFRDSLTGRKRSIHLLPVLAEELDAFGITDLKKRLLHGGLPQALLAQDNDPELYAEWLDSYYARDVQELFRVGKRHEFLKLIELVLSSSGGLLKISKLAKLTGLSRPTVMSYLDVLEITHLLYRVRPHHEGGRKEILRQPKAYGFDTGFVTFCRGWETLRSEDCGLLWEHLVLESLLAHVGMRRVRTWRDKSQHEVDFVILHPGRRFDAVECKWSSGTASSKGFRAFRSRYPVGRNFVISPQPEEATSRDLGGLDVTFCNLEQWSTREST